MLQLGVSVNDYKSKQSPSKPVSDASECTELRAFRLLGHDPSQSKDKHLRLGNSILGTMHSIDDQII